MKRKMCAGVSKKCCPVRAKRAKNVREREFFKLKSVTSWQFLTNPALSRTNCQEQDQDLVAQDQDQDNLFSPRGASTPKPKSRGLRHRLAYSNRPTITIFSL